MVNTADGLLERGISADHSVPKLLQGPEGVRGRNSENSLILSQLGWEPTVKLQDGLRLTYQWIKQQVASCPSTMPASCRCSRCELSSMCMHN
jgi:hypothetical protein